MRAARYRALSLLFLPPTDATGLELNALAADLMAYDRGLAEPLEALGADVGATLGNLYHLAMGPTGAVGLEPGAIEPAREDRRRVALPTLDESDACGLPPDLS